MHVIELPAHMAPARNFDQGRVSRGRRRPVQLVEPGIAVRMQEPPTVGEQRLGMDALAIRRVVLLRHSLRRSSCPRIAPQQGHRGRTLARARAILTRSVAIECGTWRCDRSGRTPGSVTSGKGRSRPSPGAERS